MRRLLEVARVDVDGDDLEVWSAELRLEPVEGGHLGLAGRAPRRPEIDEEQPALEVGEAGLGVAFRAKPAVAAAAQVRVEHGDLTALLYLQGYAAAEFVG